MRDFMAHQYEEVDLEFQWSTMKDDLPFLKQYCQRIVAILESESDEGGERSRKTIKTPPPILFRRLRAVS